MKQRMSVVLAICVLAGCGSSGEDPESAAGAETSADALSVVEDLGQYKGCLLQGAPLPNTSGLVNLGNLDASPGVRRKMFDVAECIVGRHSTFRHQPRPYNLQSFKTTHLDGVRRDTSATFIFKRVSENVAGEAPPQCLKVTMTARVGATQIDATITRVQQLPSTTTDGICSDKGEI